MSGTQAKLSSKPPVISSSESLERLEKLKDWTEEPSKKAAEAIGASKQEDGKAGVVNEQKIASKALEVQIKDSFEYPWQDPRSVGFSTSSFRLPTELFLKLKFLGDTTYGSSMSKILIEALEPQIDKLLKERGIE